VTYCEVAQELENFVEGKGGEWDWDNFTTGMRFSDPYLREIQHRMSGLSTEFPPLVKGHYCGPEGIEVIRRYIKELRERAACS